MSWLLAIVTSLTGVSSDRADAVCPYQFRSDRRTVTNGHNNHELRARGGHSRRHACRRVGLPGLVILHLQTAPAIWTTDIGFGRISYKPPARSDKSISELRNAAATLQHQLAA